MTAVYLINVGVPHFGEEAEGWWRVRVVNWKLDVSLGEQREVEHGETPEREEPMFGARCIIWICGM